MEVTLRPRIFPVGKWAGHLTFDGTSLWVSEGGQRTIAEINIRTGAVNRRIHVGRLPSYMLSTPDGTVYALVETDRLVWRHPSGRGAGRALPEIPGCPTALAISDEIMWAATDFDCKNGSRVVRMNLNGGNRTETGNLASGTAAMTAIGGNAWVAHGGGQPLSVIDGRTMSVRKASVEGGGIGFIAANERFVFAAGDISGSTNTGLVAAIDPRTLREVRRQTVDERILAITADDRNVVAMGQSKIWVFSADRLDLQKIVTFGASFIPEALLIVGDDLFVSRQQLNGENGAIYMLSDWRP